MSEQELIQLMQYINEFGNWTENGASARRRVRSIFIDRASDAEVSAVFHHEREFFDGNGQAMAAVPSGSWQLDMMTAIASDQELSQHAFAVVTGLYAISAILYQRELAAAANPEPEPEAGGGDDPE